jgi:hypothetical protein
LVAKAEGAQQETVAVRATLEYRLEKFDGDYEPGKVPVEVIEGREQLL